MLGHRDQKDGDVEPEQSVVRQPCPVQPFRYISDRAPVGRHSRQGERGGMARIAEAQIVDIDDAREPPGRGRLITRSSSSCHGEMGWARYRQAGRGGASIRSSTASTRTVSKSPAAVIRRRERPGWPPARPTTSRQAPLARGRRSRIDPPIRSARRSLEPLRPRRRYGPAAARRGSARSRRDRCRAAVPAGARKCRVEIVGDQRRQGDAKGRSSRDRCTAPASSARASRSPSRTTTGASLSNSTSKT